MHVGCVKTFTAVPAFLLDHDVLVRVLGFNHDRFVDVVIVALNQLSEEGKWYTSTMELQLASLQLCSACRNVTTLTLTVEEGTSRTLLDPVDPQPLEREKTHSTRVPRLLARRVKWNLKSAMELRKPIFALADARTIEFSEWFQGFLLGIAWPHRLQVLDFGWYSRFNRPIVGVAWPASLQRIVFGRFFTQSLDGVVWPASLRSLTLGRCFNQPIERAVFPSSLEQLTFGNAFNRPIEDVKWPTSLRLLAFGRKFCQPMGEIMRHNSLRQLTFGGEFNEPLEGMAWPALLEEVTFGAEFNTLIGRVMWPASIVKITFGEKFNQPMDAATWPATLRALSLGDIWETSPETFWMFSAFNQAIDKARWPASLRAVSIGGNFSQSLDGLQTWMPNLEELCFLPGDQENYTSLIGSIEWPKGLRTLKVYDNARLEEMAIPPTVEVVLMDRSC